MLTEAANSGNSLAYEMLGASTLHGTGVPKNPSAALQWYTRAAEEGRVNAQFVLGYLYSSGGDVAFNYSLANHWFLKAAKQGSAPAIVALAFHLDNGQGFERNKVKACGLLRVALKHELPNNMAEDLRVQLKEEEKALSAQQLADVSVWEALYSSPKEALQK
ncbi:tetratricopeptide repeat protein [Pseudomonas amygdali]|uniref:tetratricopeptide repeat protein n=1 Tax=Pseudomonas amygdali TaxID=47877 RepID=UPI00244EC0ED|nr:tetratricopeptide repeat protein [Pseudomonas amygdali]